LLIIVFIAFNGCLVLRDTVAFLDGDGHSFIHLDFRQRSGFQGGILGQLPFRDFTTIDLSIGIFYILSLGAGSMVAVLMAGWGSNNKYALLAALRGVATLISYEIPQVLSVLAVVMVAGSFSMQDITVAQDVPFLFALPLTALIFLASVLSELGRRPFDLVEADSEIVAGFFVEYSGMKFGMFYLGEFMNQFAIAVIFATLFLGGWRGPWVDQVPALGTLWLVLKTGVAILVIQFFQYSLPRLRIDQILGFNWKFLTPLALVKITQS
jgi:NADH-quinone oxidoreductase subunit H